VSTTVLVRTGKQMAQRIEAEVPGVTAVPLPFAGPPPAGLQGEVLLTYPGAQVGQIQPLLDSGLKWVHFLGVGIDGFPCEILTEQTLTCSRGANAVPIAEFVMASLLAFCKGFPDVWQQDAGTTWFAPRVPLTSLQGAVVGLLGLGSIARHVAERLFPFAAQVKAVRRTSTPSPDPRIELLPSLEELLVQADHLVVAAPATPATYHLLDAGAFAKMKTGSHLVNISRGSIVDQDALRDALDNGPLAGASLDVSDPEPLPANHWLYTHPKVRFTPHISWNSPYTLDAMLDAFLANLKRYQKGEPLEGLVDIAAGY